jgi:hypothetical protein
MWLIGEGCCPHDPLPKLRNSFEGQWKTLRGGELALLQDFREFHNISPGWKAKDMNQGRLGQEQDREIMDLCLEKGCDLHHSAEVAKAPPVMRVEQ